MGEHAHQGGRPCALCALSEALRVAIDVTLERMRDEGRPLTDAVNGVLDRLLAEAAVRLVSGCAAAAPGNRGVLTRAVGVIGQDFERKVAALADQDARATVSEVGHG